MARSGRYDVLITLGAVIRGDTPHFDVVVAGEQLTAAVFGTGDVPVMPAYDHRMQQALERAGIKNNLGWAMDQLWRWAPDARVVSSRHLIQLGQEVRSFGWHPAMPSAGNGSSRWVMAIGSERRQEQFSFLLSQRCSSAVQTGGR